MTIRASFAGLLLPVLLIVGISVTKIGGLWITKSTKIPARYLEGPAEGEANPADIRGSYTFADIQNAFDVPAVQLLEAYGMDVDTDPSTIQLKIFEGLYGDVDGLEVGTDSMRLFIALYKGLPYIPEETTALPDTARHVLTGAGADFTGYGDRFVSIGEAAAAPDQDVLVHNEAVEAFLVKGKTSFGDLLDWGLTREQIEEVLGEAMGPRNESVRDWCMSRGVEFSGIKTQLQQRVDQLN